MRSGALSRRGPRIRVIPSVHSNPRKPRSCENPPVGILPVPAGDGDEGDTDGEIAAPQEVALHTEQVGQAAVDPVVADSEIGAPIPHSRQPPPYQASAKNGREQEAVVVRKAIEMQSGSPDPVFQ